MTSTAALEFDQVTFGYGRVPVLREVSLRIHPGEFYAIVGDNGSGKTTLMKLGLGLLHPSYGTVRLFGTAVEAFSDWHKVGYVPQRAAARPALPVSVDEVVRTGLAGHLGLLRRPTAAHRERIEHVVDVMGLRDIRSAPVNRLSGGQQQRALIARALAGEPDLFFLDEPTAGVDLPNQRVLADSLATLSGRGATIVLVAHELGPMAPLIDRAVVMRDGRITYDGPPLTHDQVHHPELAMVHVDALDQGHHHEQVASHDHAPHIASPLDGHGEHR